MQFIEVTKKNGISVLININFIECIEEYLSIGELDIFLTNLKQPITVNMSLKEFKDKYLLLTI